MNTSPRSLVARSIAVLATALSLASSVAADELPKLLPFQGRLTDAAGAPVTNGVRLVQFRIYPTPTGGSPVWAGELHRTTVNGGLVNVMLGTKTPLGGVDFNQALYLEITADVNADNAITSADPPMLPRQSILPSVFAKEAAASRDSSKLNGADWSALLVEGNDPRDPDKGYIKAAKLQPGAIGAAQLADGGVTTPKLADGAVTDAKLAAASVGIAQLKKEIMDQLVPPGTIIAYGGDGVPDGWLPCDGRVLSRTDFNRLFNAIGITWGYGDFSGQYFRVPDLRGFFLRGTSAGTGRDPDAGSRFGYDSAPGGDKVGSYQDEQFRSHTHGVSTTGGGVIAQGVPGYNNPGWNDPGDYYSPTGYASFVATYTGGNETRPKNVNVNYLIKY